ncbi:hypothetical protein IW256_007137 [Actinomadura viridis]|uniref:Uncharacterized protein n=1 Tax=Actinomadura viridis TaxID=58110 RepID=A0A931DQQ4_9ACTN|nr:hypothetical protein [Actinomadura viridis]
MDGRGEIMKRAPFCRIEWDRRGTGL